ncbi:MAG: FHA domain-containing protein [Polyangiales bacterium]|nr:FHA domain-containing protein [Sandaracinaceae bacterium]
MARFRLKFLLQEFDLVGPEVLMGRSPECHVTLEDPLVSRQHARILIGGDTAQIMDLGSRNGTRINGQLIEGAALLHDGDRVRLGTQELLFYMVDRAPREAKTTGFMTMCRACKTPFPDTAKECPHCGTPAIAEDETFSGFAVEPSRSWTYQLLGEVVERALEAGRTEEAARMFRRVAREIELRIEQGDLLEPRQIDTVATYAATLAQSDPATDWFAWLLDLHVNHNAAISDSLVELLQSTVNLRRHAHARRYLEWARESGLSSDALDRLDTLVGH